MEVARSGLLRALSHIGVLQKSVPVPPPHKTRLTELGGDDYYVYASDPGVYEPLVEPGDEVEANQPAARIHLFDLPWREPILLKFARAGLVLCKRQPARCERGDCLFHLGTDVAG
jgi:predicted deacylase